VLWRETLGRVQEGALMPLADDPVALAALAGNSVVAAAGTDAWETVRHGVARLFGRGGPEQAERAGRRLEEIRSQLASVTGGELEQARAILAQRCAGRLADLLEEDPGAEAGLRVLVGQVQAQLVSAAGHSAAAGRDLAIEESGGGVAAGVMHASVVAGMGGIAIGRVEYQRPQVASQPVSLAPRPPLLAGREELLAELEVRLSAGDDRSPRIVALYGLGGAGKTSVAVEYAHRHLPGTGLVWQFPAEDPTVMLAEFGRLAGLLGAQDPVAPGDPVASVHAVLAAYPREWLVAFDNAPDRASVERFLPPAGPGRVLITSQSALWPPGQVLEVPVLAAGVAAGFLVSRTGDPDDQAASGLAEELGGLPLALEQASAYIQATGGSLAGYLASFRHRRDHLLARGEATGYGKTVATTWSLAFGQLEGSAPAAAGLLRLLACYAPEAIPLILLLQPRTGLAGKLGAEVTPALAPLLDEPLAAGDAIAALRRYSLVTPAGDGSVSVHRLVQAVTTAQMPTEVVGQWRQAAAALIEAAIPDNTGLPQAWPVCAALLPHAQVALADDSPGMAQLASYLGARGSYASAVELLQRVLDARGRSLGPEHPLTLTAQSDLAVWTGHTGDAAGARDQFAALLPVFDRVLGSEHPNTLTTQNNLAYWTGRAGDAAGARDQFAALLPVFDRVLGPEHPDTLAARHNLARWTGEAGDAAGARDQYAALLPIRERVLGAEHPDTLNTRSNLARWTGEAGDAAGARNQLTVLLPIRERVLGPEHPDTLNTRSNLARWTGHTGDAAGARDQYATVLPIEERVRGAEHPDTLTTRAHLARWTGNAGDAAGARDQFAMLLPLRERVLGTEHPDTLTTRRGLAAWTGQAGDAAGARDQYAALRPLRERVLGAEHPDTLITQHGLAAWTGQAGDAAGARDQCAMLLPIQARILGAEHPDTLTTRTSLARWTGEAGDPAAARDQYAAVLSLRERVLGPKHPATLATRTSLDSWAKRCGS
jgi:Tetratricopeptide repeat